MPVSDGSGKVVGHVVGPDGEAPVAGALVRARAHDAWLAEGRSLPDGAVSLVIPFQAGAADELDVTVEVFDDQGTVQAGAQVTARPDENVAVALVVAELDRDRFHDEPTVAPPFVVGDAATMLRARVRQRVGRGDLPEGALAEVDDALRPLEWLSSLHADAHGALRGEPDAADRLRLALLGYAAPTPHGEPIDDLGDVLEHAPGPPAGPAEGIVDDSGLLSVVAAAIHVAATDAEANQLVGGLSRAAWSAPFVAALVDASRTDDPQPMRTLMGLPPGDLPMPPGGPGGGFPGGGWPGGKPGWPQVPGKRKGIPGIRVSPVVADLVAHFRTPVNKPPTERERCLVGAMVQVARIKQTLPRYVIRSFDNPNACPGELLTIRGERFGAAGRVVFQGSSPAGAMALSWSDGVIQVVVPADATPGPIRLSILEHVLWLCGQSFAIYRLGDTLAAFNGGLPRVTSFFLNGVDGDTSAAPGSQVDLLFTTSTGETTSVAVRVVDPVGAVVFQTTVAGGSHAFSFTGAAGVDRTRRPRRDRGRPWRVRHLDAVGQPHRHAPARPADPRRRGDPGHPAARQHRAARRPPPHHGASLLGQRAGQPPTVLLHGDAERAAGCDRLGDAVAG